MWVRWVGIQYSVRELYSSTHGKPGMVLWVAPACCATPPTLAIGVGAGSVQALHVVDSASRKHLLKSGEHVPTIDVNSVERCALCSGSA
jgi:hypothetical protein